MLELLTLALLIYANARLARKKGKSPYLWGFITGIAFLLAYGVLGVIYLGIIYEGPMNQDALTRYLKNSPLVYTMIGMFGIGGGLLVRFILERSQEGSSTS